MQSKNTQKAQPIMPAVSTSCNKLKAKRNTSVDEITESFPGSKKNRIEPPAIEKGKVPANREQSKFFNTIAANRIQRFWRRNCPNTLHALVNLMMDQKISMTHLKSVRFNPLLLI
jgi:hypothetical protein